MRGGWISSMITGPSVLQTMKLKIRLWADLLHQPHYKRLIPLSLCRKRIKRRPCNAMGPILHTPKQPGPILIVQASGVAQSANVFADVVRIIPIRLELDGPRLFGSGAQPVKNCGQSGTIHLSLHTSFPWHCSTLSISASPEIFPPRDTSATLRSHEGWRKTSEPGPKNWHRWSLRAK